MAKQGKYSRPPEPKQRRQPPVQQEEDPEAHLTTRQKIWDWTVTIFTDLIMVLSVIMMLFTAVSSRTLNQNDRDIFGYKLFIVRSDSMSATDFSAGDLVIIKEVDPATLAVGDIVSFTSEDPDSLGETFTHKIRSIETDDFGQRSFITYGTTTGVDDAYPVPEAKLLGQYRFAIPNMGTFFAFMKTTPGYICCIGIPFLLMLLIQGGGMITSARGLYKEKEEAVEAAHQQELTAQQKTIENQQAAMRKLFQTVHALEKRVEALEKERE